MLFPLGEITFSWSAMCAVRVTGADLFELLLRHSVGDAGLLSSDAADEAIRKGDEVDSAYDLPGSDFQLSIATSPDRKSTGIVVTKGDNYAV